MTIRWFVEVSPVDASSLKERYCVEALQWQQALQQARKLRGDKAPLARFAMELLEVGYRATDPTTRLRYTVSKAPADAPLSTPAPKITPSVIPAAPAVTTMNGKAHRILSERSEPSEPEIEELSNPMLVALPPPLETAYEDALPTMPQSAVPPRSEPKHDSRPSDPAGSAKPAYETRASEPAKSGPVRPSQIPLPRKSQRARNIQTSPAVPRPNRSHPPAAPAMDAGAVRAHTGGAAAPNLAAVPEAEEPIPTLPGLTLISLRREEPTEAVPILYREYAMSFDANLTPRELERYARAIWEQVKTNLAHRSSGKFVQVALFDHRFSGRPERAPAAVLAWKDWRGDPVIRIRTTPAAVDTPPGAPEDLTAPAGPVAQRERAAADSAPSLPAPVSAPAAAEPETAAAVDLTAAAEAVAAPEPAVAAPEPAPVAPPEPAPVAPPEPTLVVVPDDALVSDPIGLAPPPPPATLVVVPDDALVSDPLGLPAPEPPAIPLVNEAHAPAAPVTDVTDVADVTAVAVGSFPAPSAPPPAFAVLPPPVPPPLVPMHSAPPAPVQASAAVEAPVPPVIPAAIDVPPPAGLEMPQAAPVAVVETPAPAAPRAREPSSPHRRISSGNAVRRRGSSEDLIGELFEEMHQLHFMPDIVAGADYVLSCVLYTLPCEGVLVHVFDIDARQFVVVRAAGPSYRDALLYRTPDTYGLFRESFRRSATVNFPTVEPTDERYASERFEKLGVKVKSAMCGAVQHGGRYLGVIELVNPLGGEPFRVTEVNALDYICEQFADFVASRPVVLDEDTVLPKA